MIILKLECKFDVSWCVFFFYDDAMKYSWYGQQWPSLLGLWPKVHQRWQSDLSLQSLVVQAIFFGLMQQNCFLSCPKNPKEIITNYIMWPNAE